MRISRIFSFLLRSKTITKPAVSKAVSTHSRTFDSKTNGGGLKWMALIGVGGGTIIGVGYGLSGIKSNRKQIIGKAVEQKNWRLDTLPDVKASRVVPGENNNTDLELWLYQYQTCPFCCKVRAFLDYYGLNYSLVEVNPVLRKQVSWSPWKKVPVVLVKDKDGYQQMSDSSMIMSALSSYLIDRQFDFSKTPEYYPVHPGVTKQGREILEVQNKYFIMHGEQTTSKSKEEMAEERKWRSWVDDVLVHTLSPNVYRTPKESLQAFNWFSEVGHWKEYFSAWERYLVIYVGAAAMYFIGKRLKKRYNLDEDVRLSFYNECNNWVEHVKSKGEFGGGSTPDLSDIAVYGILNAVEGCDAWKDVLQNTEIGDWFYRMRHAVRTHQGAALLLE